MSMTLEHRIPQDITNPTTTDREAIFDRKRAERNAGIDGLVEAAKAKGETLERFIAAIEWDSVHAPKSTNQRQLAEIGIHPPAADALGDEDLPPPSRSSSTASPPSASTCRARITSPTASSTAC